jgi:error-prone DNA polymerase
MSGTYAALWCKSNFSFLEGASHPEELVESAHRMGLAALAITDRDGVHGIVRAHEKARELGLPLLYGSQISLETGADPLVLLVEDRAGYANLCQLITLGRLRSEKGQSVVSIAEVCAHAAGLLCLWRGHPGPLPELSAAFGDRLYAMLCRHRRAEDVQRELDLREHALRHGVPLVAAPEVLYHTPARRPLQDVLTCIRHGVTVHTAGCLTNPNAEHDLKSPHAFRELHSDIPEAVVRTLEIAGRCRFSLSELRYRYPSERLPDGLTSSEWLRRLTERGAQRRFPAGVPGHIQEQIGKELALIDELDYCGYFLTMHEIVEFCAQQNILCQGRGSAANSAVCYCLGVTAVDPRRIDLLFERFISRERAEPPDIDLDIEHERREEVIQHVYAKHGRDRAAMVANVIRYRSRSAIRDVGKALGLSETALDRVAKLLSHLGTVDQGVALAGLDTGMDLNAHLLRLVDEIYGFPRHLSIHPGGFLLGHEPIATLVPIENATMAERTVIQWDKDDVEAVGLFKVDLLGLGALTHLHRAFDLIDHHHGEQLSIATIPEGDQPTYQMIQRADTVGVFQIESRAQMSMLPRLKPASYYDLVIEVSIVRPGPITGGMVHPFLRRREKKEPVQYPHPALEPVLKKTLGVPLFQEQVMRLAVVAADYTPGEADRLRRDMAAWRKTGRLEQHKEKLITRMQKKGIALEFAENVFKQICGFGEYGFPESHAASFAIISYVGSFLKCHYPAEFTCALLNSLPMGFYSASTIVEDARRHGVEIRPVDVQISQWECTLEASGSSAKGALDAEGRPTLALRMGLCFVKGLGEVDGKKIVAGAPYKSVDDFGRKTGLNERSLRAIAEANALSSLGTSRRAALWQVTGMARAPEVPMAVETEPQVEFPELSPLEAINWDYRRMSHSASGHPLSELREVLRAQGLPDAQDVAAMKNGRRVRYAGVVICRQHPGTAAGVTFMTLEDETGFVNVVLWKQVFEAYALVARTVPFLGVTGKLQVESGVVHIIAEELWRPKVSVRPESGGSHDFH